MEGHLKAFHITMHPYSKFNNKFTKLHQSADFVCPSSIINCFQLIKSLLLNNISGARYSGVPQKVFVLAPSIINY